MPISKVKSVKLTGNTWDGPNGTLHYYDYEMEDGTKINAGHQTNNYLFNAGDEVEYHVRKTTQYGNKGSVKKPDQEGEYQQRPQSNSSPSRSFQKSDEVNDQIIRQSCLKASIEYHGGVIVEPIKIAGLAQYFFEYCKTGELKPQAKEVKNEE